MPKNKKISILISLFIFFLSLGVYSYSENQEEDVFINQLGEEVRLKDFKDKVVLMIFSHTSCRREGCYLLNMQLLRVQLLLKDRVGKDLFLLSFSIDPETDTPEALREYAKRFKLVNNEGWFFLTGNPGGIDRLQKTYGAEWITDSDGARTHKVAIVLLNQKGETEKVYTNYKFDVEKIVKDIRKLLK